MTMVSEVQPVPAASLDAPPENLVEIIETVIASLHQGDTPLVGQTDSGKIWMFRYGSAEVFVQLGGQTEEDFLTIWSPVLPLPVTDELGLYRKLLTLNWLSTLEAHFAIAEDQVQVVATRTLGGITAGEISRLITIVATLADDYDDPLRAEFKG
ncbi:YbjN domain-containing protein [Thermosynechococcus sichuanensis E542]|uniref:YbjN domain-containing protein n=1 Tax=Thermosynechococcus sichuanensis E542 TaxID=2016101 RepID=A0A3B7MD47_9CYAN|nr:YbjN domain-containing protein [Thermosynechococcus vestitus]AXY67578.1 YbjN domain-containing protein [Thermosynechococcus vestitus E542]